MPSACLLISVLENKHRYNSQSHQFADVFHRRAAEGNDLVVVLTKIEIFTQFFLSGRAKIEMFADPDEIGGELGRAEPCALPLCDRFALLNAGRLVHVASLRPGDEAVLEETYRRLAADERHVAVRG